MVHVVVTEHCILLMLMLSPKESAVLLFIWNRTEIDTMWTPLTSNNPVDQRHVKADNHPSNPTSTAI